MANISLWWLDGNPYACRALNSAVDYMWCYCLEYMVMETRGCYRDVLMVI